MTTIILCFARDVMLKAKEKQGIKIECTGLHEKDTIKFMKELGIFCIRSNLIYLTELGKEIARNEKEIKPSLRQLIDKEFGLAFAMKLLQNLV
ncbi:hypothetical protein KAJ41_00180 [Candidatus Parcubacteria bacterium]|nr:hypothetical protein [Candidatus Parcubacteria bacterium]